MFSLSALKPWRLYPNAHKNRIAVNHPSVRGIRVAFFKVAAVNFLMLQTLFLAAFAYIYGSLYQQTSLVYNFNILYVDYDGGVVGASIRDAYQSLQSNGFPSLLEQPASQFPPPGDIETAICQTQYWAAVYTSPGASSRLEAALAGGTAATNYNRSDVVTYIWNEARYSTISDSEISGNIQNLSSTARIGYSSNNGIGALQKLPITDAAAISVFANPWQLTAINIQPTVQGSRLIYNTLVVILVMIQEFFYLGTINGLYGQFKLYERFYPHRIIIFRNLVSLGYTFIGSLCTAGAIWAFRAGWDVNANQFALTWAVLWLFAHLNFLTLDVFTIWLPPPYVPMSLITWIVLNVTSILLPFELSSPFYHWAYAMPAHETYQVLTDIWSHGCNPQLYYALPILFAFEISSLLLSGLGVYRRCHFAVLAAEEQKEAFQHRLDAAVAFERAKEHVINEKRTEMEDRPDMGSRQESERRDPETAEQEAEELREVVEHANERMKMEHGGKYGQAPYCGPVFELAFRGQDPKDMDRRTSV